MIAGTSLVLFIEYLVDKYEFPVYLPTMSLIALIGILPSVLILAYFHGAPGKDEWTKIEKIGIPVNVLFIGIMVLIGNNYNWWLGDVQITSKESSKRVLIAEITSNDANMELVKHNLFKGNPGTRLEILLEEEKNSIYDELISYLNMKTKDELLSYYTKYDVIEHYTSRGEATHKYNFDYIKAFTELDFQHENLLVELTKINSKYLRRDNSMPNYMNRIDAELGYFPIIYKTSKDEYSLFHFVANNNTSISGEDTSYQFKILYGNEIVKRNALISAIDNFIDEKIYYFTAINRGKIEIVDDNNIIIKFDEKLKHRITPRMIFKTQRMYYYNSKTDTLDDLINAKINDILDYEYHVDMDSTTKFYNDYYTNKEYGKSFSIIYTKEELNHLLNGTHSFFKMKEIDGTMGAGGYLGIDIQILEVYDSTATAIYFKHPDPNIKLRKGDIFLY